MTNNDNKRREKQNLMRQKLPLIEGVWDGTYRYLDDQGRLIDQHSSRLILRFAEKGTYPLLQTNIYTWDDGRRDRRHFAVDYINGRLLYDNDLIKGYFERVAEDDNGLTTLGYWRRKDMDGVYFYEMIQRSADRKNRTRVWQCIKEKGGIFRRTIIDEVHVSDNWQAYRHELQGL